METWRRRVAGLRGETYALYLAMHDARVPLAAKVVTTLVVAYALSPIDLIPDFIPVLGYLDDLIVLPLGIALAIRLVPSDVLAECRAEAERRFAQGGPKSRAGAAIVVTLWLLAAIWIASVMRRSIPSQD